MSADILQFLKNKFMDELEEAEEEHPPAHDIPLHSYFLQIRELLETKSLTPSTGMKDCLYDLSIALTDCILFLEKRKMKINKDSSQGQGQGQGQGQRQGHYSLPELWFLCKTKRKLIHIKKKLRVATSHPVVPEHTSFSAVTDVATTSSSSGSLSFDGPEIDDLYSFRDQVENIANLVVGRRDLDEKGFSKEIGIVGIGGCGKTLVARMVFDNSDDVDSYDCESRIWINLQAIQKGEVDFKKILKAMLKQCDGGQRDSVEVEEEELLEALCKALWSKSYLLVFDGIWDINLDWYFRLKERLQWCNKSIQSRLIIITTRLHGVAKRMVGPNNLYRMQPFSNQVIWGLITWIVSFLPRKHPIVVKMEDEMIYHSHGLPLAATTFNTIMRNRTLGGDWDDILELAPGKTLVARTVFNQSRVGIVGIWINLQAIQKGEIDFKKILKAMLKQCDDGQRDFVDGSVEVEEEELLEALCKALWSKSYLLVFDGIWDINLDWYFRLKERLQWCSKSNQSRLIIITTRLHGVAKRMVGPNNLYRMQPFSNLVIWGHITYRVPTKHPIVVKMKDEMIYHSHGLPLAATTFFTIMRNQTYGGDWDDIDELLDEHELVYYVMINPKDDANQGNDLLLSLRSIFWGTYWVGDISEVVPQLPLHHIQEAFGLRSDSEVLDRLRMVVFGGDATTNRVLRAVCDMELHPTPPIGLMPLGTQVNISISLGWGNQISDTDARLVVYLTKLRDAEEILIDSWNFVVRTSIPNCLEIPNTLHVRHVSEDNLLHMGGDKDLCGRFWNYLIIGLDAQELFGASHFKSWPRNIALPISVKIKDHQHQWKKLNLPQSIRSIVCLNMPSFPGGLDPWGKPNFRRKKERNFTSSFVDDELLEIIGFRDSWHGEIFLPLNDHGTRLAQAHQIRFELHKGVAKHIDMNFDGTRWKQPTPIGDDNFLIEISYSCKTKMLATSASKCKHKSKSYSN